MNRNEGHVTQTCQLRRPLPASESWQRCAELCKLIGSSNVAENASGSALHGTLGGSPQYKWHSLPASVCVRGKDLFSVQALLFRNWWLKFHRSSECICFAKVKDVEMPAGHISLSLICPQCCSPTCCATAEIVIDKTHIRGSNYRASPLNVTHSSHVNTIHISKTH